jgi:glucose/mannose-6-phosphate isomerase
VRQRIELTASLVEPEAAGTVKLESRGSSAVERVMSLVMLGDLVSVYLAVLRGTDPTPVEAIERLQESLEARETV